MSVRSNNGYQWFIGILLMLVGLFAGAGLSLTKLDGRVIRNTTLIRVQQDKLDWISTQLGDMNKTLIEISKGIAVLEEGK